MEAEELEDAAQRVRAILLPLSHEDRVIVLNILDFCEDCGADLTDGACECDLEETSEGP